MDGFELRSLAFFVDDLQHSLELQPRHGQLVRNLVDAYGLDLLFLMVKRVHHGLAGRRSG